ncbi:MAG: class I SAM-dependent methyltransferase [Xanthomonadaceae bacterium]|nr:class I SAM-dependent methyltransferase [Xanthomonadaceae bacterium]
MERLSFSDAGQYSGLEASIHMARYAIVRSLCVDKVVLDMACGEGYGSRLLAQWGARRVVGVDISAEAIDQAQRLFASDSVEFRRAAADTIDMAWAAGTFDLIVSLETIEHVPEPVALLESFKRLLKPDGVMVISCPNDWWYYPSAEERNPFHLRKYTFDEFQTESERVLGRATAWYFGAPMAGFCNSRVDQLLEAEPEASQASMLRACAADHVMALPSEEHAGPCAASASYFVGIWSAEGQGAMPSMAGAAMLPVSMDAFKNGFFAEAASTNRDLRHEIEILRGRLLALEKNGLWVLDEGPLTKALARVELVRKSLHDQSSAPDSLGSPAYSPLRLLNRAADIEKSLLLAQLQRLKVLYEDQGGARELVRVSQQKLVNEMTALRASHESRIAQLQDDLDHERTTALTLQESLRATQEALRQRELDANLLQLHASRYLRLRQCVPEPIRRNLLALVRRARRVLAVARQSD